MHHYGNANAICAHALSAWAYAERTEHVQMLKK